MVGPYRGDFFGRGQEASHPTDLATLARSGELQVEAGCHDEIRRIAPWSSPVVKERTACEVQRRFHDEQDYIERYTRFLSAKSTIHDHQVLELNRILQLVKINPLPTRRYGRTAEPYSPEETAALLDAIRKVDPEVYQTILGHEQYLD